MREDYHEQLELVRGELVHMTTLVATALGRATSALLDADLQVAESVIASDIDVDALADRIDNRVLDLIALQSPSSADLRTVIGALRMSATLERMGDLAEHIAQIARNSFPESAVPASLVATIQEMGELGVHLASKDGEVIASGDVQEALYMESEDDRMDELQRELMSRLLADDWEESVGRAVDLAMAVRFYERFADHSVSVARQVVQDATGQRVHRIERS